MTKSKIAKYVANTALLAVLAAAGIGVYQLGTSGTEEKISEKVPSYYDEGVSTEITQDNAVDATDGEVLVDGVNVKDYKQETLHNKIGYVPQKAVIFNGTINENVSYGENLEKTTKNSRKNKYKM